MTPDRKVYCNRTLNFRSLKAIGYDMDYTLVHYHVEDWERIAYEAIRQKFLALGWPVENLSFEPARVCRGLVIDTELGNLVKANRFGFIKTAMHGTRPIDFEAQRAAYSRTLIDLSEPRWIFLNTLFSLSEGCMYAQLVDLLDERRIPEVLGYVDLYEKVRQALDNAHMEGQLKAEILRNPERYIVLDPETPLTLLDQKHAGKKLMLITNSEWAYTSKIMSYCFDRFLPNGMTWRQLFEVVVVSARKPSFFTTLSPIFEVVTEDGLLRPAGLHLEQGKAYLGGSARQIEKYLKLSGDEILYVGDHVFGDVHVTKNVLRWRTALILRELEGEIQAIERFKKTEHELARLMSEKEEIEAEYCQVRLLAQRKNLSYTQTPDVASEEIHAKMQELRARTETMDESVAPLARASTELSNEYWGLLMRTGNDKSYLAYQMERYADIYTSRVSNLLYTTPFAYMRSHRGSLPHDT
ncbi:MAG: HAD-IG family 5'-nucleotidase [Oligoflexia bacterium]|nr:HAD-IG family 5'-nucleotidase [Oligoflexia bacterium]